MCLVSAQTQPRDYLVTGAINGVEWTKFGAQHTLVSAKTVTRDDYTGETVPLRMADGKEHHLPLAIVHIQLGSDHILSTVAVSDRLGDDALPGTDLPVFNELLRQATTERAHAAEVLQVQTRCQTRQAEAEKRADDEATSSSLHLN